MRARLTNRNDCAVPFLRRAAVNLCWHTVSLILCTPQHYIIIIVLTINDTLFAVKHPITNYVYSEKLKV